MLNTSYKLIMNNPKYEFNFVSSLEKVFFNKADAASIISGGTMLKNEIHSFQLVAWTEGHASQRVPCQIEICSDIADCISAFTVDYVPSTLPIAYHALKGDTDFLTTSPGMFPDPLRRISDGKIELSNCQARSLWFSVEPDSKYFGKYPISITIKDDTGNRIAELTYNLEIINVCLPELEITTTGWFHGDCISVLHNAPILSEKYWEIVKKFLGIYTKFGHNMILTPVLTPPLDTAVGGERPTNQLVDIEVVDGEYHFSFSNLKRWIRICLESGIKFFEISHFFTQWGAKYAPKVMATVDGTYRQIFGWNTLADSEEYGAFLGAFLPELVEFLSGEGVFDRCWFHISDEPVAEQAEGYLSAKNIVTQYISEDKIIDALSDFEFFEKGIVTHPVVSNDHIHRFLENNVPDLRTYYCVSQHNYVSNRFMAMPSYRNRVLGWQLYKYNIRGFLQWGFNFWFSQYAICAIDPYRDTTAGGAFPSGDAFLVYPLDDHGEVVRSLRLYVFNESLQDLRALKLLEKLAGRKATDKYLAEFDGFEKYPRNSMFYVHLRESVNEEINNLLL